MPLALKYKRDFKKYTAWDFGFEDAQIIEDVKYFIKDKKPILLLFTYAILIGYPYMLVPTIPRRNGAIRKNIMMSLIHLEYTMHMRGVDVVDQLRASCSMQNRTHKWWYQIFFFLLDMIVINIFIIYLGKCKRQLNKPINHLQFMVELCEVLL